ncbi:MAG: dimethyl sulfoxide reductase anchor subunit [Chromatiales bacterium]|nr:dimethyl sulfoxide reductase anchor subunit [Chromatiales bacterium]
MFQARSNEPAYARVPDAAHPAENRYGVPIETVPVGHGLRDQSLGINGDHGVSSNPNRYKQHGFYFNADRCIACHACEAACSEKNDLPAHLAFRSVGYVEGGSYPAYQRLNISMACNHCDDPVCLKGCPTRAYTKFAEYGAVLQDPDICFGCGYCTWVCPYNAPQLDTQAGHVSKCNMCVDRLEVGLKPACAAACLAGALDFGIVETTPAGRDQLETRIPGFPDPTITHPNIRFQQTRSLPGELTRPDAMPLRYVRESADRHRPAPATSTGPRGWGIAKLSTRENPLVVFTLVSQAVVGLFAVLFAGRSLGLDWVPGAENPIAWPLLLFTLIGAQTLALVLSTLHLGRPHRFYRAFNNLRWSPVSREVAGIAVFYNLLGLYTLLSAFPGWWGWLPDGWHRIAESAAGAGAVLAGIAALYFMHRIYRIPARPYWDHWQVLTAFLGNMLGLGAAALGLIVLVIGSAPDASLRPLAALIALGLTFEAIGLWAHARAMRVRGGEGAAAMLVQATMFGHTAALRYALLAAGLVLAVAMALAAPTGPVAAGGWLALSLAVAGAAILGRMLFYALVIPTTMPGAFFWRNRAFEAHARETGLADLPQTGVLPAAH